MIWDRLAKNYDHIWVQKKSLQPTRAQVGKRIESLAPRSVLDVGCGTGQLLLQVLQRDPSISCTGFDKSSEMIAKAREKGLNARFFIWEICSPQVPFLPEQVFDLITCTHSFPYYGDQRLALQRICECMGPEGHVIFVQASINNLYDRLVMSLVEKTAETANYLSRSDFLSLTAPWLEPVEQFTIKEAWYMPSICGFVMKKRK